MGDGNRVHLAHIRHGQPRRLIGRDARANDAGLVACDGVEGQRRAAFIRVDYLSIRNKAELDERLEAVADTRHKSVALLDQLHDILLDGGVAEEGGDELAGAVRLVTAGEAAGYKHHLRGLELVGKPVDAAGDAVGCEVVDNDDNRLRSRVAKRLCGVKLAVRAGECGNQHLGLCALDMRRRPAFGGVGEVLHRCAGCGNIAGIDAFKLILVNAEKPIHIHGLVFECHGVSFGDKADRLTLGKISVNLNKERAVVVSEKLFNAHALGKIKAEGVSEAHFHYRLRDAAHAGGIAGIGLAGVQNLIYSVKNLEQGAAARQTVFIILGRKANKLVSRRLKFRRDDIVGFLRCDGKGDERGRNVKVFKRAGHGILSADGGSAEPDLCLERAEQRSKRLPPALRVLTEAFKILLECEVNILKFRAGRNKLCTGLNDRKVCAVIGAFLRDKGVIAPAHKRAGVGVLALDGNFLHHCLNRGELILAAEGH